MNNKMKIYKAITGIMIVTMMLGFIAFTAETSGEITTDFLMSKLVSVGMMFCSFKGAELFFNLYEIEEECAKRHAIIKNRNTQV